HYLQIRAAYRCVPYWGNYGSPRCPNFPGRVRTSTHRWIWLVRGPVTVIETGLHTAHTGCGIDWRRMWPGCGSPGPSTRRHPRRIEYGRMHTSGQTVRTDSYGQTVRVRQNGRDT